MTVEDYERQAATTAVYETGSIYPYLGLIEEIGEVAGVLAKAERDNGGNLDDDRREQLKSELGDVLWMLTAVARDADSPISSEHRQFLSRATLLTSSGATVLVGLLGVVASEILSAQIAGELPHTSLLFVAFWRWSNLCYRLNFNPEDVAAANLEKLASRAERGKLQGSGDDR